MASPRRYRPRDLIAELGADASRFGFFQAARLLSLTGGRQPGTPLPARLRFRSLASLSFPASELVSYRPAAEAAPEDADVDELTISFMGLTGPSGVLPVAYTELLLERKHRARDHAMHAFFDVFTHRATSLFFGAWRKYRFWIGAEAGDEDGFSRNLLDLTGLGQSRLRENMAQDGRLDENLFIYYAGLLSQRPLSAQALAALIQGFFGVDAHIEQYVGQWCAVPEEEQTRLGQCVLGTSVFAGARIWDRQTKIRLCLGPMRRERFEAMQPGGSGAGALLSMVRYALGNELEVDVTLVLDKRDVPPPVLGGGQGVSLGASAWLESARERVNHPDEMRYTLLK